MFRRNPDGRALFALLLLLTLLPFAAPARAASLSKAEIAAYADQLLAKAYPADAPGAAAIVVLRTVGLVRQIVSDKHSGPKRIILLISSEMQPSSIHERNAWRHKACRLTLQILLHR
jgi:hypothetical protein